MTDISHQRHPSTLWPLVRAAGEAIVYAAVPFSLGCGPILQLPDIRTPVYIVAALGFIAVVRGADRISSNLIVRGLDFFILGLLFMAEAPLARMAGSGGSPRRLPQAELA